MTGLLHPGSGRGEWVVDPLGDELVRLIVDELLVHPVAGSAGAELPCSSPGGNLS